MRFTVRLALTVLVIFFLTSSASIEAKPPRKPKENTQVIVAHLTFHDARPNRKTCNGVRQTARMAAINRKKTHYLMGKKIVPFAYRDKKTGRKIFLKLSQREIGDVMGPSARRSSGYHIDYYISGPMPANYEKFNNATWYFKVE